MLRRGIDWITGPEVKFKRDDDTGFFKQPEFHIGENNSRGDASMLTFLGSEKYDITDMRYTTCVAGDNDWYLTSADVELDRSRLVGTAHDATVYFKSVPILYSPYLSFPLSNERKTGFLTPVYGSSNQRGFEVAIPYYLNLAPNYDATLLARPMSRRGLQLGGQFRYLFADANGEADAEILPHDRITDTDRWAVAWKHNQNFGGGFAGFVNVQKVSDDTYFADLSDRLALTSQTNLPRDYGVTYNKDPVSFFAQMQSFQTLQDPNNPITPPYNRLPQVTMTIKPVEWQGFDWGATGEFVRFQSVGAGPQRQPFDSLSDGSVVAAGQLLVRDGTDGAEHDQLRPRKSDHAAVELQSRAADLECRRWTVLRARHGVARQVMGADLRTAPVLRPHSLS